MNQTLKVIVVTAAGFAAGYALYSMLQSKGVLMVRKTNGNGDATQNAAANPQANADAIGDAVAGVLID